MAEWHDIVLCDGSPESDQLGFRLNVSVPDATCEVEATERQADAVKLFYQYEVEGLCDCQAHALLSCREYARLSSEILFKAYPERIRRLLAPCLAAFLTSDPAMVQFVTKWSERNFERGTGSPRVRGSPIFADVEQFADFIKGCMDMNGWTLERIKARWPR